jgi:predicted DNA-binding protein (MmcQ/YjbR family)
VARASVATGRHTQRYFVPPYVGPHDWVGLYLDGDLDWGLLADLVVESYRMTAPQRLVAQLAQP